MCLNLFQRFDQCTLNICTIIMPTYQVEEMCRPRYKKGSPDTHDVRPLPIAAMPFKYPTFHGNFCRALFFSLPSCPFSWKNIFIDIRSSTFISKNDRKWAEKATVQSRDVCVTRLAHTNLTQRTTRTEHTHGNNVHALYMYNDHHKLIVWCSELHTTTWRVCSTASVHLSEPVPRLWNMHNKHVHSGIVRKRKTTKNKLLLCSLLGLGDASNQHWLHFWFFRSFRNAVSGKNQAKEIGSTKCCSIKMLHIGDKFQISLFLRNFFCCIFPCI